MPTGWRPEDVTQTNPIEIIEDPYNYQKYDLIKIICFYFGVAFN